MDGVSAVGDTGSADLAAALSAVQQVPVEAAAGAAILKKGLDAQKDAMGELLKLLGIGQGLDVQA